MDEAHEYGQAKAHARADCAQATRGRSAAANGGSSGDDGSDAGVLHVEPPDHVWALDVQFQVTTEGCKIKILHVLDKFTRGSLVGHSIVADVTETYLEMITGNKGRCPESSADTTVLASQLTP